jgi:hypothetical protein
MGCREYDASGGAAYLFRRTGPNSWDTGTKVVAPDAQADDYFGHSIAPSGDYAIVGAYWEDGGDGDPSVDSGAACIYAYRRPVCHIVFFQIVLRKS